MEKKVYKLFPSNIKLEPSSTPDGHSNNFVLLVPSKFILYILGVFPSTSDIEVPPSSIVELIIVVLPEPDIKYKLLLYTNKSFASAIFK